MPISSLYTILVVDDNENNLFTVKTNISHKLRTPLNILLGSMPIIKHYLKNDEILDRKIFHE